MTCRLKHHMTVVSVVIATLSNFSDCEYCPASAPTVSVVSKCPTTMTEWDEAASRKKCNYMSAKCGDKTPAYHCLLNQWRNETVEVCASTWYISGFCAVYNTIEMKVIDDFNVDCTNFTKGKCPTRYISTDAYKYQMCYDQRDRDSLMPSTPKQNQDPNDCRSLIVTVAIFGSLLPLLTVLLVLIILGKIPKIGNMVQNRQCAPNTLESARNGETDLLLQSGEQTVLLEDDQLPENNLQDIDLGGTSVEQISENDNKDLSGNMKDTEDEKHGKKFGDIRAMFDNQPNTTKDKTRFEKNIKGVHKVLEENDPSPKNDSKDWSRSMKDTREKKHDKIYGELKAMSELDPGKTSDTPDDDELTKKDETENSSSENNIATKLDPGKISDTRNDAGLTSKHETENTSPEDNIELDPGKTSDTPDDDELTKKHETENSSSENNIVTKLHPGKISDTPNDAGLTSKHETENTSPEDNIELDSGKTSDTPDDDDELTKKHETENSSSEDNTCCDSKSSTESDSKSSKQADPEKRTVSSIVKRIEQKK